MRRIRKPMMTVLMTTPRATPTGEKVDSNLSCIFALDRSRYKRWAGQSLHRNLTNSLHSDDCYEDDHMDDNSSLRVIASFDCSKTRL